MKYIDCNIICDLLPLYIDHACSKQSADLVKAHLQSCEKCRQTFEDMQTNVPKNLKSPDFDSKAIFRGICKNLFGIIIAIAAMTGCFISNAWGAFDGGPARTGHLVATILYLFFWGAFSIVCRKYRPLIRLSFIISLLTFISAVYALICITLGTGGFLSGFIGSISATSFYGLRILMDWTELYATATVLSLCWLIYTAVCLRKLEKFMHNK